MMAQACGYQPGDFIHTFGDAHIYTNHMEQIELQLSREPKTLPTLIINPNKTDLFKFSFSDFTIENYDPHPHIKGAVAV
jgi:thymidylate synthase